MATRLMLAVASVLIACGWAVAGDAVLTGYGGGEPYRLQCPAGTYLTALRGEAGEWIDWVETRCARWNAAAQGFERVRTAPVYAGTPSDGATSEMTFCRGKSVAISRLEVGYGGRGTPYANWMRASCRNAKSPGNELSAVRIFADDSQQGTVSTSACGEGEMATGIYGRAGRHIDAIGLTCAPIPETGSSPIGDASTRRPERDTPSVPIGGRVQDADPQSSVIRALGRYPNLPPGPTPGQTLGNGSVRYDYPHIAWTSRVFLPLDWCKVWANECGQPAADEFCKRMDAGRPRATAFEKAPGMGTSRATVVISSGERCDAPHCDGFVSITCGAQ